MDGKMDGWVDGWADIHAQSMEIVACTSFQTKSFPPSSPTPHTPLPSCKVTPI